MKTLARAAKRRGKTMKEVAAETGVSETTLSRMNGGKRVCDAASMAALSAWAGINPARFSGLVLPRQVVDEKIAGTRLRANVANEAGQTALPLPATPTNLPAV